MCLRHMSAGLGPLGAVFLAESKASTNLVAEPVVACIGNLFKSCSYKQNGQQKASQVLLYGFLGPLRLFV